MSPTLAEAIIIASVGAAGWIIKDFWFTLFQRRRELERSEWEFRLKEIYSPLFFWSGLLFFDNRQELAERTCSHIHEIMAKAGHILPRSHYYTLIRILQVAHGQATSNVPRDEWNELRDYLYDQIEVLNFLLYRSEETGGVGDPTTVLTSRARAVRTFLGGFRHTLAWIMISLVVGGIGWLAYSRPVVALTTVTLLFLLIAGVDLKRRAQARKGIAERLRMNTLAKD